MILTTDEVRKIADLCRIALSDAEVEKFQKELTTVLEYASELNQVDTEGVVPISQVTGLENVLREDQPRQSEIRNKIIELFPERKDDFLKIKNIL